MAAGDPAVGVAAGDTESLCSDQFGFGPTGDISYIAPCEVGAGKSKVTIWLDSVWDSATPSAPITNFENPCSLAKGGCSLEFDCLAAKDVALVFNVVLPARQ